MSHQVNAHHNRIARLCRQVVADLKFGGKERKIPDDPWDEVIFNFASSSQNAVLTDAQIKDRFRTAISWMGL